MSQVLFFIAAIGALAGAVAVVSVKNPFYAVLALVFHLVSLAALFLLLRAEFVAAAQVVVYAGAVMVLYVFVVAYVGGGDSTPSGAALRIFGPVFALCLGVELLFAFLGTGLSALRSKGAPYVLGFGTPREIGRLFLTDYLFVFEVASLLLLVAAIGAVLLARRRRGLEPEEDAKPQRSFERRPLYTGTMAEAGGLISFPAPPKGGPAGTPMHTPPANQGADRRSEDLHAATASSTPSDPSGGGW